MHPGSQLRRLVVAASALVGALACGASPGSTDPAVPVTTTAPGAMGMGGTGGTPSPPTTTTVPTPPKSGTGGALSGIAAPATWITALPVGGRAGAGGGDALGGNVGAPKPLPGWTRNELGVDVAKPRPAPRTTDEAKNLGWFR